MQLSPHSPNKPGTYLPPRVYVAHQKLEESAIVQLSIVSPLYSKGKEQVSPSTVLHPKYEKDFQSLLKLDIICTYIYVCLIT